jgi:16S rRNA (guanine527-N7)-methyltransferase
MGAEGPAPDLTAAETEVLTQILFEARSWGFLGPGPVEPHIAHALGFAAALGARPRRLADLGSGGGVPGLVLAQLWPETDVVLIDANQRRTDFLTTVGERLDRSAPPTVVRGRAEEVGREAAWRASFDAVVARGFASPAVTAECAAPLLVVGGRLVVSEPPDGTQRWPSDKLRVLGLEVGPGSVQAAGRFQLLRLATLCPAKYPRSTGRPAKRPLF